jgi:hypothetical protein
MTMKLTSDAPQWTLIFGQQFIAGRRKLLQPTISDDWANGCG